MERYQVLVRARQREQGAAPAQAAEEGTPLLFSAAAPLSSASSEEASSEPSAAHAAASGGFQSRDVPGLGSKTTPAGLTVLGASINEQLELHLAPDLRRFGFFGAAQYVVSHLLVHLVTCLFATLLVTVVVTGMVIALGGFEGLILWSLASLRNSAWVLCTRTLPPYIVLYILVPALGLLGTDLPTVLAPLRRLYMLLLFWLRFDDGPYILAPRVLLAMDAVLSCTLGPLLGVVDAFTRIVLSTVWGVLRSVVVYEPVG
jgi:hypothetical protein